MGAGPWLIYYSAKRHLMDGQIDLDSNAFWLSLFASGSNASDLTRVNIIELTNEVAPVHGYTAGGKQLQNVTWDVADSADEMRFTADTVTWQASGGDIASIGYTVLRAMPSGLLVAVAQLDEGGPFTVPNGNPLEVAFTNEGIFELK